MKLSDLKGISKFKFIDKILSKVEDKCEGKEIEFYNIDLESVNKIKTENDGDDFLYKLVSVISNVETDVTFEEFNKMVMFPSIPFRQFIEQLLEHYKNMFRNAKELINLGNKSEDFIKNELGKDINMQELIDKAKEIKELEAEEIE